MDLSKTRRREQPLLDPDKEDSLPPHSIAAEQGVLGCILLSPDTCLNECEERLGRDNEVFYDLRHQKIFNLMRELREKGEGIDLITLQQRLKDRNELEAVGGFAFLASLPDQTPSAANLPHYLGIVREKRLLRRALRICAEAMDEARANPKDPEQWLLSVEARISALTETQTDGAEEHIQPIIGRAIDQAEKHYIRGRLQLDGLPTGPNGNYLDKLLGGIRDMFYVVIAGRPGDGKSSLAMNIVEWLANDYTWPEPTGNTLQNEAGEDYPETRERRGIPVAVFSIEMDGDSLGARMLFGRAGVDLATFKQGYAEKDFVKKLTLAAAQLSKSNIWIDASPAQSIGQIAAKARRMARQHGIKLFVLDYLQLVEVDGGSGFDRVRELTKISRKIMALKKQLQVPWLVLAQMNRNIETSEAKRVPMLSDLKDCGAIEQDADVVLFLYRPDHKELDKGDPSDREILAQAAEQHEWSWAMTPQRVNAFVAKHRFGPTGIAKLLFHRNLTRFEDWHLWKVAQGTEPMKRGERESHLDLPSNAELGVKK